MEPARTLNIHDPKNRLRAYYIRQFRKTGYQGNGGGWVWSPDTCREVQGWSVLLSALADSVRRFALHLSAAKAPAHPVTGTEEK